MAGPSTSDIALDGLERPRWFGWGVLMMFDPEGCDLPMTLPRPASATRTAVCVSVRHAEDAVTDLEEATLVTVAVHRGPAPHPASFETVITVPSGRLEIGDVDHVDVLTMADTGPWQVQICLDSDVDAEKVDIYFTPARLGCTGRATSWWVTRVSRSI